jgi:photosystem II stability/assembly factor-like uncharacterized protein
MSVRRSHAFAFVAAFLALMVVSAGCGSGHAASSGQTSATPTTTPPSAGPVASSPASPSATPHPHLAAAPADFKATSITFVSSDEAFCLGTAPGHGTLLLRTLDRGQIWARLAAPSAPPGRPGFGASSAVWGTRFASPSHGFIFGNGLWETTDGGARWALEARPSGSILSLVTIDGQVLALVARNPQSGSASLLRRPLTGGSWSEIASIEHVDLLDPTDLISTEAGTAAVLNGTDVLVTTNGGLTDAQVSTPIPPAGYTPESVAVTSSQTLALLCVGQGYTGHTDKRIYTSDDLGARWFRAGEPSNAGDAEALAGGSPSELILVAASAASWIDRSTDGGQRWRTPLAYDDGGQGWADLGFTTPADAVVVHGPADANGNRYGRPGQLLLSSDGGATWQPVTF